VKPNLITVAKGMGNGFPVAAVDPPGYPTLERHVRYPHLVEIICGVRRVACCFEVIEQEN